MQTSLRHVLHAALIAGLVGFSGTPGRTADFTLYATPGFNYGSAAGVPCVFEDGGPDISLPWPSVWLGHFSGGRFTTTAYGNELEWKNEHVCFPSKASCDRWIGANRRAFHHPEGYWTCLPIR